MESLSSSGELSDICRDMSLSVERLSNHIVQQTLTRQRWPPPCALISIARGCGNPRQYPAKNLITTIAPSLLNAYCCLPSYVLIPWSACDTRTLHAAGGSEPNHFSATLYSSHNVETVLYYSCVVGAAFEICRPTLPLWSLCSHFHSLSHSLCYIGSWAWLSFWHQHSIDAPRPALIG